ncbi:TonB-dependent siderophore receptor [Pseudomonas sp. M30-35]|uniref:TonB-dependent siderophore receptor n=1 Tax=Pseudomonas sp. M30-35 TaxID=1981174 RepID=UPI000B3C2A09|nr:TonB-dependent siderophore receptor [Pseudomonas sp. M30-35]ARU88241.1 TonB-dependent siderophore receptor [Pseudomonas sp. M30-35]
MRSTKSHPTRLRQAVRCAALMLPLAFLPQLSTAAQDEAVDQHVRQYSIAPGKLSSALSRFAGEAGVMLSVDARLTEGKQTQGLNGEYDVNEGFRRLLEGTGLRLNQDAQGGYTLHGNDSDDVTQLPATTVKGFALGNALGNIDGYNATHSSVATKTSLPLLETSQSVSVVTREQMDDQGAQTVAEAMRYTPGVMTNPYGATHRYDYVAMRGFNDGSVDNLFLDGLKMMGDSGTYSSLQVDPYFLERIDILKGPSSVLYGRSLPGGLAAMTTKKPEFQSSGQIQATVGSNNKKGIGFDFTGPLDDQQRIAYRLTGLVDSGDTQFDYADEERYALMPSVSIDFSEDTNLTLQAYLQKDPNSGYHGGLPADGTINRHAGRYISEHFFEGEPDQDSFEREQQMFGYQFEHRFNDTWSARQNFRYQTSDVSAEQVYAAGWANDNELYRAYTGADEKLHAWIIDTMLQAEFNTGAAQHTVVTGFDYQRRKTRVDYTAGSASNIDAFDPIYGGTVTINPAWSSSATRRLEQTGVYLQDLIALDNWRFSLGMRQDWVKVESEDEIYGGTSKDEPSQFTGRAGVLYLFDNGVAPYMSYSESFNPNAYADQDGNPLAPTEGKQWEFGLKFQPNGTEDLYTAALFHIDQENLATKAADEDFYRPVGAVRSQGLELEARLQLTDAVRLLSSYTYTDIEYSKSIISTVDPTLDNKGNSPTQAAEHMASMWLDYSFLVGSLNGLKVGAGVRYVGDSWADAENTLEVPSYTLVDASVGYDLGQLGLQGVDVRLNANNLTNEKYVASCGSLDYCYFGEERNVTATVSYNF